MPTPSSDLARRLSRFSRARMDDHEEEMSFLNVEDRRYLSVAYRPDRPSDELGAVFVHSFGFEQATLHTLEVMVARALAARGIPSLYLAAEGYGDSSGDQSEATMARRVRDAHVAVDRLLEVAGVGSVALMGARYGASVALLAAQERVDLVRAVAAWHPLVRGRAFFDSMLRSAAVGVLTEGGRTGPKALRRRLEETGLIDLHGYPVHRSRFEEGSSIDLVSALASAPADSLLVQMQRSPKPDPDLGALEARLAELGSRVTRRSVELAAGQDFALPVPHSVTPFQMLEPFRAVVEATVGWVGSLAGLEVSAGG